MYCNSGPGNSGYSNIELVNLVGDTTTINNNTSGLCDSTEDYTTDRKSVVQGKSVDLGGRRIIKKKNKKKKKKLTHQKKISNTVVTLV